MNIMLDLETLGTKPGCVILSIGAVVFDPKTAITTAEFYIEINTADSLKSGLWQDRNTLDWWEKQDQQAKDLLDRCASLQSTSLYDALTEFITWTKCLTESLPIKIWANDPSFDCRILEEAIQAKGLNTPWKFYNERSCRTMVAIGRDLSIDPKKDLPFLGTAHNALDDAIHQVKYVSAIHQYIHSLNTETRYKVAK